MISRHGPGNSFEAQDDLAITERLNIIDKLLKVSEAIVGEGDLSQALQMVADCAADAVEAESTAVGLIDWNTKELHYVHGSGVLADKITGARTRLTKGVRTLVSKSGEPVIINDAAVDDRIPSDAINDWGIHSLLVVPMKVRKKVIGTLLAANRKGGPFEIRDLRIFETIARHGAAAVAHADLHTKAKAALAQLDEAKIKIEAVLDQLGDGVVVCDTENKIILINSAAEKITGLPNERVYGMNLIDVHPPHYRAEVEMILKQLSRSKPDTGLSWEQNIHMPGERVLRVNMRPVFLKNKTFVGIAMLLHDITEIVALDEAKTEFISTVAHELRTPLTSLKGSLGLVLGGAVGDIDPGLREMLGISENNCNKLIRLVDDMLDIAKIETGHLSLEMDIISVQDLVVSAVNRMRQFANECLVELSVKVVGRPHKVIGDGDRIEQVVTNFLSNAIKFSPEGASVEITVRHVPGYVKVSVTDHGPGIPLSEQKKVFEKFYQSGGQRRSKTNGSGLGLAISKGIIEQHGGKINLRSTPGNGSTFCFLLPIPGEEPF